MNANIAARVYAETAREQAREELILSHLGFVRRILSSVLVNLPDHVDREALQSAGIVGLVEAANAFDPTRGVNFRSFAFPRIRGAILDELRQASPLPQKMLKRVSQLRAAWESLPPPVTPEDLARATGLSLDEVVEGLDAMRFVAPQPWNDLFSALHSLQRGDGDQPDQQIEHEEMRRILAECIQKLPDEDRVVIMMYYVDELSLQEIGAVLEITESAACRRRIKAEFRLKELVRAALE